MPVSGDTLLRLVRAAELEAHPSPRVVGVNEWAWRRGQRYGTIICGLGRGRVIDLLPERSSQTVAAWLRQHHGVEVVARDRGGAYAEGARQGAPEAMQVADRWHLLRNLGDALQGAVGRHRGAVRQATRAVAQEQAAGQGEETLASYSTKATRLQADRRAQRQGRYEELSRLRRSGLTAEAIAPALGMSATAARRWLKAEGPPAHDKPRQPHLVDEHVEFLERRWHEGCRDASRLWRKLCRQGFTGSWGPVVHWAARQRREDPPPQAAEVRRTAAWPVPSSRWYAKLLTTEADKLGVQESTSLARLAEVAPDLAQAGELATGFAALVKDKAGEDRVAQFKAWLASARGTELIAFVRDIDSDHDAVLADLVEPWSTGPAEGQINRLKLLKRSMYGRASHDLLRQRVLAAA